MAVPRRALGLGAVLLLPLAAGVTMQGCSGAGLARPATTAGGSSGVGTTSPTGDPASAPPHVMVIVMENESSDGIVGNRALPYINGTLAAHYRVISRNFAVAHPSLPNYLELLSGSTWGVAGDCSPGPGCMGGNNLAAQLDASGIPWAGYMENLPAAGSTGRNGGGDDGHGNQLYQVHHNPFAYFPDLAAEVTTHVKPLTDALVDLSSPSPPAFVWVTPNMVHDMHDGPLDLGDTWLSQFVPAVQATAWYQRGGVIIVTWDEGAPSDRSGIAGGDGGHVAGFVISPAALNTAADEDPVDQAGILRSVEQAYGLAYLNDAAQPAHGSLSGLP